MARTREYMPLPLLSADTALSRDATEGQQQPSNPSNVKVDLVTDMQHQETDSVYLEPGNLDKLPPYCMFKKSCANLIVYVYSLYYILYTI